MTVETGITALAQAIGTDVKGLMPKIQTPIYADTLPGNAYSAALGDVGKDFLWNGTANITFTVPDALPDGFGMKIYQFDVGGVTLNAGGTRQVFANGTASGLSSQGSSLSFLTATLLIGGTDPVRILFVAYDDPLPTIYVSNAASLTRNVTTMSAITGLVASLDANSVYEIDLEVSFTSAITTNTLKLGFAALPSGATVQMTGVVFNTNVAGTSPCTLKPMFTSADVVAGVGGASAVTSGSMLATIKGRITTTGTSGTLQATAGAIATTGNVSVAVGAATMKVKKVL